MDGVLAFYLFLACGIRIKGKIDQADLEVTQGQLTTPGMFSFLSCEYWNIDMVIKKMMEPNLPDLGAIPGIPDINFPKKYNGGE